MKKCKRCEIEKSEEDFYLQSGQTKRIQGVCKECCIERQKQRRLKGATTKKHRHVCTSCKKESWLPKDVINRKRFKNLCGDCAQQLNYRNASSRTTFGKSKDWAEVYNDPLQTGETLDQAKQQGLMYYKRECPKHGYVPYATSDQSCRICSKEKAQERNKTNIEFNRPRVILGSVRRRAKRKDMCFNLTTEDIRGHIPDYCPVLHIPLAYDTNSDSSPSIDRYDNNQGYTKDNINIISNRANRLKSDGSSLENLKVALWQLKNEGKQTEDIIPLVEELLAKY